MATMVNTSIDTSGPILEVAPEDFEDGLVVFGATATYAAGTILARDTSTQKFQLYVKGGNTNGNGVPVGVLCYAISRTGAGDVAGRVAMHGKFNKNKLVIHADGDDSNIDAAVTDLLRTKGLIPVDQKQLARLDNPQGSEVDS